MTKTEVYETVVDITKKTGQGLSGIVKVMGEHADSISHYLDELIEEGYVIACDTGGSIGHPESNIFYMPTKGYNVWTDEGPDLAQFEYSRHKGRYLTNVRFYLGAMDIEEDYDGLDEDDKNLKRHLNPSMLFLAKQTEFMKQYAEWLERNEESLQEMLNLEVIEFGNEPLDETTVELLTSRGWYTDNNTVGEAKSKNIDRINTIEEILRLSKRWMELKEQGNQTDDEDYTNRKNQIIEDETELKSRQKLDRLMVGVDRDTLVQDLFRDRLPQNV